MESEHIEQLKTLVREAKVRMMTIDTSIFNRNSLSLDSGLIGQLAQFKRSRFELVISEVVAREVVRQIAGAVQVDLAGWKKVSRRLKGISQTASGAKKLDESVAAISPAKVASRQWDQFLIDTNAQVVSADHASIDRVMELYFEMKPPFGPNGKRHEFPDAIALIGLEEWAKAGHSGMLVVTADMDWTAYCAASSDLYAVDSLATALEIVNASDKDREARAAARQDSLLERLKSGDLLRQTRQELQQQLLDKTRAIGTSSLLYEAAIVKVNVRDVRLFDAFRGRDDDAAFVLIVDAQAHCEFWARFDFRAARGQQDAGSGVYAYGRDVKFLLIITATGSDISVEVLIVKDDLVIDFGEVEPDGHGVISNVPD